MLEIISIGFMFGYPQNLISIQCYPTSMEILYECYYLREGEDPQGEGVIKNHWEIVNDYQEAVEVGFPYVEFCNETEEYLICGELFE